MLSIETALRLAIIGQQILIATVFLTGRGNLGVRVSASLFLLSVSAYLLISDPSLSAAASAITPMISLLAMFAPFFLWAFARAVFEAPWPRRRFVVGFVVMVVGVWFHLLLRGGYETGVQSLALDAERLAALFVVAHALYMAATGQDDDLIEKRRRFRVLFIGAVALQVAAVLAVELAVGDFPPGWLNTLNVIVIAILTFVLAIPLLRLSKAFFRPVALTDDPADEQSATQLSAADAVVERELLAAMSDGVYRQTGLTIRELADQLGHPEHRLRKLINGHLGYRNFSAFLNSYRLPEAKERLGDAKQVRIPVLTIALDLGYGSLGPFNRAFKADTGLTPTQYRQTTVRSDNADSE
jgi:AraC-like DNA-binding protein